MFKDKVCGNENKVFNTEVSKKIDKENDDLRKQINIVKNVFPESKDIINQIQKNKSSIYDQDDYDINIPVPKDFIQKIEIENKILKDELKNKNYSNNIYCDDDEEINKNFNITVNGKRIKNTDNNLVISRNRDLHEYFFNQYS